MENPADRQDPGLKVSPTEPTSRPIAHTRRSGNLGEGNARRQISDQFPADPQKPGTGGEPGAAEGSSYRFSADAAITGGGRAGGPPTSELDAAEQILQVNLDYAFSRTETLAAALTHPTWRNEHAGVDVDNQRLEFLGDLVVGLAVGELLMMPLPQSSEGELSVLKAQLVRESTLARVAVHIGVGPALRLGRGEEQSGGRLRPALLADALEAVVGAVFVDGGYAAARAVVARMMAEPLAQLLTATRQLAAAPGGGSSTALHVSTRNFKTALQEWLAQGRGESPEYRVLAESGHHAARSFQVQVQASVGGVSTSAVGDGPTVKSAENAAAEKLLAELQRSA